MAGAHLHPTAGRGSAQLGEQPRLSHARFTGEQCDTRLTADGIL